LRTRKHLDALNIRRIDVEIPALHGDRLLGDAYTFSVAAAGRNQLAMTTLGAIMGGHVRVGLEDNLYLEKGRLAESNAEQVTRIREILAALSIDIATPEEARARLGLKGGDKVDF